MNNLISIICTSYNHAEFVRETIESIWEQDYKNIEIIVVDDGSKDSSPQVLTELAKQSPLPMEVILQENTGKIGLNVNRGIAKAKGEFIMFTSCDDKFAPNILSKLVSSIKEDENKQFVFCVRSRKFGIKDGKSFEEENHQPFSLKKKYTIQDLLDGELHKAGLFWIQNTLFRRCVIEKVGGFDEDLLGDDIVLRIKILKEMKKNPHLTFDFINEVGFYYRIHENNIHKNSERQCRIIYEVNKRYFPNEKSKILPKWVSGACKNYLRKGEYKKAFKLFFGEMNQRKLYYLPLFLLYIIQYFVGTSFKKLI
jgi:alpha-1,3-rhamnosyltransferase